MYVYLSNTWEIAKSEKLLPKQECHYAVQPVVRVPWFRSGSRSLCTLRMGCCNSDRLGVCPANVPRDFDIRGAVNTAHILRCDKDELFPNWPPGCFDLDALSELACIITYEERDTNHHFYTDCAVHRIHKYITVMSHKLSRIIAVKCTQLTTRPNT